VLGRLGTPEVLTDFSAVERLLPEWRALAETSARSALEAPDWQLPLARRYLNRYGTRFLAWRAGDQLVGVAPLALIADRPPIRPIRQLAWWGSVGPRMRGLTDVVATDAARDEVLDSFGAWLRTDNNWDILRVVRPQFESATPARLRRAAADAGWAYAAYANLRSTTYQLDLPDSEEGWEKHLGSKARKVMRWETRKFAERGGVLEAAVDPTEVPKVLDACERLLRAALGRQRGLFRARSGVQWPGPRVDTSALTARVTRGSQPLVTRTEYRECSYPSHRTVTQWL